MQILGIFLYNWYAGYVSAEIIGPYAVWKTIFIYLNVVLMVNIIKLTSVAELFTVRLCVIVI